MIIRPITVEDAEDINIMRRQEGVMENVLSIKSERLDGAREFIKNLGKNEHVFVAEVESKVVGIVNITVMRNPRKNHIGILGIMVNKEYQHQGIGKKLMEEAIDLAKNWLMLKKIELDVITINDKAINLYKSLGFEIEGEKKFAVKRQGKYENEYVMGLIFNN